MKERGKIGTKLEDGQDTYWGEDKPAEKGKKHWYEEVDFSALDIPYCIRPKGKGLRIDFYTFANLFDKAMEIKESAPWKFRHTGDVNRNAHYIGMYILEQIFIKEKNHMMEERVYARIKESKKVFDKRGMLREQFRELFDKRAEGLLTQERLEQIALEIAGEVEDKDLQEWFISDCDSFMNSEINLTRARNKLRMREVRQRGTKLADE